MKLWAALAAGTVLAVGVMTAAGAGVRAQPAPVGRAHAVIPSGIHKIKHVIVIMQENRSFDTYFGTYPGADGIPPGVCMPDPHNGGCVKPYANHQDSNFGGQHIDYSFQQDVDGGKMDGFIGQAELACTSTSPCTTDVMGYHTASDIPNYWAYAKNFVLNDHMYEAAHSWSLPSHLYEISAWSANCSNPQNPMTCTSALMPQNRTASEPMPFGWTDLTWLLHTHNVSWGYYLDHGPQTPTNPLGVLPIWNVLTGFTDVHADGQILTNVHPLTTFMAQAQAGTLPSVSWILPDARDSEHPSALVSTGQAYVTRIINAVMSSSDWGSTAIFLAWDDWGGFYDHVNPLSLQPDSLGYGFRVPALVISPYAKRGYIDHQTLTSDAYLKFIEDDFLGGARLNPATDGRPDPRPDVRENASILGNLVNDFNFSQTPLSPLLLNPCPPNTTLVPTPRPGCTAAAPHFSTKNWGDS